METEILELGHKVSIRARAYKKSRRHLERRNNVISMSMAVVSSVQAAISTYSLFENDTIGIKATNMLFAVAIATASAYITFADFPETIARYEAASSMYTHVSAFFSDLYNNLSLRTSDVTEMGLNYCKSTISFLDGMSGGLDAPSDGGEFKLDKIVAKFQQEIKNICEDTKYIYLPTYRYTYEAYAKKNYFHIIQVDGIAQFCKNHVNISEDFILAPHFQKDLSAPGTLFKSWIIDTRTMDKKYVICERSQFVTTTEIYLAVIVDEADWFEADLEVAHLEIAKNDNILDSDLFNPDVYQKKINIIIEPS